MAGPAPSAQPEARSILVVDDDPVFASVVEDVLKAEGYRVSTATSGLTALELVGATPFDLILIDIRMPGLDGPGFFRELQRRDPPRRRRPRFPRRSRPSTRTRPFSSSTSPPGSSRSPRHGSASGPPTGS